MDTPHQVKHSADATCTVMSPFQTESVFTAVFVSITVEGRGHHNRDTTYTYRFVNSSLVIGSVK